jgi:hypothetical protein
LDSNSPPACPNDPPSAKAMPRSDHPPPTSGLARSRTANITPATMIVMAIASLPVTRSPSASHASPVVKIGVTVDTTIVRRAPSST